jgi:hypothetical protein
VERQVTPKAPADRKADASIIARYLERFGWPRIQLFFILLLTGVIGVGVSVCFLQLGLRLMWIRYPLAAAVAYAAFLWALRFWAHRQLARQDLLADLARAQQAPPEAAPAKSKSKLDILDWFDVLNVVDDVPVALAVAGVLAVLILLVLVIAAAPLLLADILLDALLVAGLWRRRTMAGPAELYLLRGGRPACPPRSSSSVWRSRAPGCSPSIHRPTRLATCSVRVSSVRVC